MKRSQALFRHRTVRWHEKSVTEKPERPPPLRRARSVEDKIEASQEMSLALKGVFAIGEGYPELKSSENFRQLQTRISSLEDTLADRRETYNECVTHYNTRILHIPDVFFAGMLGYRQRPLYQITESEKQMPSLKMNLSM